MKHIFTIHSPLTFLVAYSVIEHLGLDREEVILISSKYKVPIAGFKVAPSFSERYAGDTWQKLRYFNVPVHFDRYIDELTQGEAFTAYVDLMSYYQKILVSHDNCQRFHFIEEGNSTYQAFDDLTDITWNERTMSYRSKGIDVKSLARVLRGYNLRTLSLPYIYTAYTNLEHIRFFVLSNNAFYNAPSHKKVLLKPDVTKQAIKEMAGGIELSNEVIWIDGSNARYTGLPETYYHKAIDKAIRQLKKDEIIKSRVCVKLRPGLKDYSQNKLISILKGHNLTVEVLPDNMILECFFIRSTQCHVIGTLTSALEYAHVFGHKAYSIYGLFEQQPPTFFDRMTGFWENIENLRPE